MLIALYIIRSTLFYTKATQNPQSSIHTMASYLESLPGFCVGQMVYEEYMGEHFNTKGIFFLFIHLDHQWK